MSWKNIAALTLALSLLGGCSVVERLVYRIDINQGNFLEAKDVDTLRFGMNKEQVRYVLGSPMLVEQGHPDTWYYVYYHKPGHDEPQQKDLKLSFDKNNKLIGLSGDYQPSPQFMDGMNWSKLGYERVHLGLITKWQRQKSSHIASFFMFEAANNKSCYLFASAAFFACSARLRRISFGSANNGR